MLTKRDIERAVRSAGYSVRKAKAFVGRLPSHWFNKKGGVIEGAIERDADKRDSEEIGPVEKLLARKI